MGYLLLFIRLIYLKGSIFYSNLYFIVIVKSCIFLNVFLSIFYIINIYI